MCSACVDGGRLFFGLVFACLFVAAAPPASSIRGASVTARAAANAEVAVSRGGDVYLAVAESDEQGVAVWRYSDGVLHSLPRLPVSPAVERIQPITVGTAGSVALIVDEDDSLLAAAVDGGTIRVFRLGPDGWMSTGAWSAPTTIGRFGTFTMGAADGVVAVAAVQCQDRTQSGDRWTRVYRVEFVAGEASVSERLYDWEDAGSCHYTRLQRTIPVGTERRAILTNHRWPDALQVEPGPMMVVDEPPDRSVLESPSGAVVAPVYKLESRRGADRGFVLWGRRQPRGFVSSAAETVEGRLAAVGMMHLAGGHEHTDANRIAVVSADGGQLVTPGLVGVRVPLHSRWELLPRTTRPMALFQHEHSVSLVEWRDDAWSSVLASPVDSGALGEPNRIDESPVLTVVDGALRLEWWSQGESGGRMERVERTADGWTPTQTVMEERVPARWRCGARGDASLSRVKGGGVTLVDSICGSTWDRWHGATEGSWVSVFADGRRLGRPQRSSGGWDGRAPRRCFGLAIGPYSEELSDDSRRQSETCAPVSAGRIDGHPSVLVQLGTESWLFHWDGEWVDTRLPDGQWWFSRRGELLLNFKVHEEEGEVGIYRGVLGAGGNPAFEAFSEPLELPSALLWGVLAVELVGEDQALVMWADGETPNFESHARLWNGVEWRNLDDGLPVVAEDIWSVEVGPLGDGHPAFSWSSAGTIHFAVQMEEGWVTLGGQVSEALGRDSAKQPTFAATDEMACFAWSQEDGLGAQIVSRCVAVGALLDD